MSAAINIAEALEFAIAVIEEDLEKHPPTELWESCVLAPRTPIATEGETTPPQQVATLS